MKGIVWYRLWMDTGLQDISKHGLAISQHVQALARAAVEDEISDEVTRFEDSLEDFAGEETPIAGESQVSGFEGEKIGRDFG